MDSSDVIPTVGKIVHYVARGSADGVYTPVCRAAIVAEVLEGATLPVESYSHEIPSDAVVASLVVLNPTGIFFNTRCVYDAERQPGTWHSLSYCDA